MARDGMMWQAKSVAPWRSGVINWHEMARPTQRPRHVEDPNPEAHPIRLQRLAIDFAADFADNDWVTTSNRNP